MQPLQIETHTDTTPLARSGLLAAQRELAKSHYLFDDTNHRFDCTFAQPVDRLADRRLELIRHLLARTRLLAGWRPQRRKAFLPTRMMRITPGGNVGVNRAQLTCRNISLAKVAIVQRARSN